MNLKTIVCCLLLASTTSGKKQHFLPGITPRKNVEHCELPSCGALLERGKKHTCRCCGVVVCDRESCSLNGTKRITTTYGDGTPAEKHVIHHRPTGFTGQSIWWCTNCVELQKTMFENEGYGRVDVVYCLCTGNGCRDFMYNMYSKKKYEDIRRTIFDNFPNEAREKAKTVEAEANRKKEERRRKNKEAAERKQKAEHKKQEEKRKRKEAARQKQEAERKRKEAERKQEAERKRKEATRKKQEAERKREAERKIREAERERKEAERKIREAERKRKRNRIKMQNLCYTENPMVQSSSDPGNRFIKNSDL